MLDPEEQAILTAFEAGQLKKVSDSSHVKKAHQAVAEATFKKDARINIRISSKDLRALQTQALKAGIPYQTFVSSILHKFVDGQLIETG